MKYEVHWHCSDRLLEIVKQQSIIIIIVISIQRFLFSNLKINASFPASYDFIQIRKWPLLSPYKHTYITPAVPKLFGLRTSVAVKYFSWSPWRPGQY